jgi:hypothetical protein
VLVGLVAAASIGCIEGPRNDVHTAASETTSESASNATTSSPATATSSTPMAASPFLGKEAPEIAVDGWVGAKDPVLLRDQEGKIVVLVFCKLDDAKCASVHDEMTALQEKYGKDGVVNVELAIDQGDDSAGWKRIAHKIANEHLPWAIGYGGRVDYTRLRYGIEDVPAAFVIDTDGKIVWSGTPGPQSTLDEAVGTVVKQGP